MKKRKDGNGFFPSRYVNRRTVYLSFQEKMEFYTVKTLPSKEQFENILEENDWFESEVLCFDPTLLAF
jgi:hypothetical protein